MMDELILEKLNEIQGTLELGFRALILAAIMDQSYSSFVGPCRDAEEELYKLADQFGVNCLKKNEKDPEVVGI